MRNSTHMEEYMRILVIGAGVLGCNLANDFFKAKKDITLLARGKWAKTLRENGLAIRNKLLFRKTVHIPIVEELKPNANATNGETTKWKLHRSKKENQYTTSSRNALRPCLQKSMAY